MKFFFSSFLLTTRLSYAIILLATAHCSNCDNITELDKDIINQEAKKNTYHEENFIESLPSNDSKPALGLTIEKEIIDNDSIPFTLTNSSSQVLNISDIQATIMLHETKDFDEQDIQEGKIIAYNNNTTAQLAKESHIKLTLDALLDMHLLASNEKHVIKFGLEDIDNLATAKITFQLHDRYDNLLAEATTSWRVTKKIGPFPGQSKLGFKLNFTKMKLDKGQLVLPITFENSNNHLIDLKKADYRIVIIDPAGDPILDECCLGENVRMQRAIIEAGKAIELFLDIPKIHNKEFVEKLTEANIKYFFSITSKLNQENLGEGTDSLDLQVGPIHNKSKINLQIHDNLQIKKGNNNQGIINIHFCPKIINQSDHPITPKLAIYHYKLSLKDGPLLTEGEIQGKDFIPTANIMIPSYSPSEQTSAPSYILPPIAVALQNYTEEQLKNLINNKKIIFELKMFTKDKAHLLGTCTKGF